MRPVIGILCGIVLVLGTLFLGKYDASGNELLALSAAEQQVVDLVNAERAKAGLPGLAVSAPLTAAARGYASYMMTANFFSHTGPDGSTLATRDEAAGYQPWSWLGENLAAGQSSPESALAGWMASAGHRANILSPDPKETGVGYVMGGSYRHYWVQEFGRSPASLAQLPLATNPQPATTVSVASSWTSPVTGHSVSGEWLSFLTKNGNTDNLGYPRTEVIADPTMGGQTVQFFQRAILELHPENPAGYRIQRRLLGDVLYPGVEAPVAANNPPPGPAQYFPFSPDRPTGLGHFIADYARSGQPLYFKQYFDSHGGANAFGFPKEEPKQRNGVWTQRFQAAVFEYHPENDGDGTVPGTNIPYRNYRVQLELLGDKYTAQKGLGYR